MNETMSSPNDWAQFYHQQNLSGGQDQVSNRSVLFGDQGSADATAVSTTTINSSGAPSSSAPAASSSGGHLSPEGRVGKPVRRRSRASRRTPTTLLNTDTTNFRAMVQQFTGGPSAPFAAGGGGGHPGGPTFGFTFGGRQAIPHVNHPAGSLMVNPPAGFHLQQYHNQQQQFQPQNQGYNIFSLNSNNNSNNNNPGAGAAAAAGGELFLQRIGNSRANMEGGGGGGGGGSTEGFVVEGVSSQVPPSRNTFLQ